MKVLALSSYPLEAACTRYRIVQYVEPLAAKDIHLTMQPFLNSSEFSELYKPGRIIKKTGQMLASTGKRLRYSFDAGKYDAVLVQREAMLFGPPIFEWLSKTIGKCPLILDLDDATYVKYISPTYGRLGSALKFFGKTDKLIDWSETVICGNRYIAEYVEKRGTRAVIVPTVVNTNKFSPVTKRENDKVVIGWIGTHSTFPFLETIFPVLEALAQKYDFILKIVGAGMTKITIKGVTVENLEWSLEREAHDFQSLDIGLYPLNSTESLSEEFILGKSGFKAIQYLSVGIPFVVTPLGITKEIGVEGESHFAATTQEQWYEKLAELLSSSDLRKRMGAKGRLYALENFTVERQSEIIASTLSAATENFGQRK